MKNFIQPTLARVERSPDPILSKPSGIEDLLLTKNIGESLDSNDVELSGRVAAFIQPSKTVKDQTQMLLQQTQMPASGEANGAPHGRALPVMEPLEIRPSATTTPNFATQFPQQGRPRQANPDIQDIITGIVKLLNGNVNVQANTAPAGGRPTRPLSTRINNRGPPRISDVPALPPDFDVGVPPTKAPTPYPFDLPPQNTSPVRPYLPLFEQARPSFHRPVTIPPWSRPNGPHRRPIGPYRRPKPPFKPIPIFPPEDTINAATERPGDEDILTLDLGSQLQPTSIGEEDKNETNELPETTTIEMEIIPIKDTTTEENAEISNYEKNKEKSSSKMEKHTSKVAMETSSIEEVDLSVTPTIAPSSVTISNVTLTDFEEKIENSSMGLEVMSTPTPTLESSIQEVIQTLKEELLVPSTIVTTSTEALPDISSSSNLGTIERVNVTTEKEVVSTTGTDLFFLFIV